MTGREISEEEIQRIERYVERSRQGQPAMNYMLAAHDAVEALCKETLRLSKDRIWVSEDRCTLVTVWSSGTATVATRDDPSHTWGPPITLTEEKT